jgi:hypothetical protein
MLATNTLAYYEHKEIMDVKRFTKLGYSDKCNNYFPLVNEKEGK